MIFSDDKAKTYDDWYLTPLGKHVDSVESECAFNLLTVPKGCRILDVGCGSGLYSMRLAEMGYEVIGIDISNEMLIKAKEKAEKRNLKITFLNMDVYNLKLETETFDGIFSITAFEFMKDSQKSIDEMMRVLKKDGELIIGTINRDSEWGRLYTNPDFIKKSVFKYASLKTMNEMKSFYFDCLVKSDQCLFIPPNSNESEISIERENLLKANGVKGGFLCLKWIKK